MLTETGRVVAVEPEALWVETIRKSTCGTCAAQKGCGHGLMNKVADGRRGYIRVLPGDQSTNNCQVDDQVLISIPEELILRGSLIAYMLPLASMLGGAIAGVTAFPAHQDVAAALGCVAGMVLGFCLVRWHSNLHSDDPGFQPTLVKVLRTDAVHVL